MSSENISKIIEKIKKLRALATNNTNEAEMKAAAAAADKLLQEYRITEVMVGEAKDASADNFIRTTAYSGGRRTLWREVLLNSLCNHYSCVWYMNSRRQGGYRGQGAPGSKGKCEYVISGVVEDTEIVCYMLSWISDECERLGKIYSKGRGISYGHAWLLGCAEGIALQFKAIEEAEKNAAHSEQVSCALVALSERKDKARLWLNSQVKLKGVTDISGGQDIN